MKKSILFLLLVIYLSNCNSEIPRPYCFSKPIYNQFPLTIDEILTHDMSESFTGYNLTIELKTTSTVAKLTQKIYEKDRRNAYIPLLISHYIEHTGNTIGKDTFILYEDLLHNTHLFYGQFDQSGKLPDIKYSVVVSDDKNIKCFDAALFLNSHGLALVDCIRINTDGSLTNLFYNVDLTSHSVISIKQNPMFAPFTTITSRTFLKYSNTESGKTYIIRAYYGYAVNSEQQYNTYFQIFSASDPTQIQLLSVVDRTSFSLKELYITDIKVYLDDIFLLDKKSGLYRLDIPKSQQILRKGFYQQVGMNKFAIYSNDQQEQLLLALSNDHSISEIDWGDFNQPVVVHKYSLMQYSQVHNIILNDKYVIVQSKADGINPSSNNESSQTITVNYVWIFTKNSRTYTNAYHTIYTNDKLIEIDYDADNDLLFTADDEGLVLYQLSNAKLSLHQNDQKAIGQFENFVFIASSNDHFNSNKSQQCQQSFTIEYADANTMKIWQTGLMKPVNYSSNYPGQVHISIDDYYIGANLSYEVVEEESKNIPSLWWNKLNQTHVEFDKPLPVNDISFFHTDLIMEYGSQTIYYYYEDTTNNTHLAQCKHLWEGTIMKCEVKGNYHNHTSRILSFTTAYFIDTEGTHYYYIYVLTGENKIVKIIDTSTGKLIAQIIYSGLNQAQINSITTSNGLLYVLRKNVKTIDAYSLTQCRSSSSCSLLFSINSKSLKPLEIDYFAPQLLVTDSQHPQVLFIKCLGSLLILDVDNKNKLYVLDEIVSQATRNPFYRIAVNKYRMILVAYPSTVEQYSLAQLYLKDKITLIGHLPLYGYTIQPDADIQFSDRDILLYINAVDPVLQISVILVYRTGFPIANSFYTVINLDKMYSRPGFEIEVSGAAIDFLSIIYGNNSDVYRVFEIPALAINNSFSDYFFRIKVQNSKGYNISNRVGVQLVNYPSDFYPSDQFNKTMYNVKISEIGLFTYNDAEWFIGNIIGYNYSCDECGDKIKLHKHIDDKRQLLDANSYKQSLTGGVSVKQSLQRYYMNGSIMNFMGLPKNGGSSEKCSQVATTQTDIFIVTACQYLGVGIKLYITSTVSFKAFTWGPYSSKAYGTTSLQIANDILMVVDVSVLPEAKYNQGFIYLYCLSFDMDNNEEMNQLEIFSSDDLYLAHDWPVNKQAYFSGAHLVYNQQSQTYRIYITEVDNGFFIVEFQRSGTTQIHILSVSYVNMDQLLIDNNLHMPLEATYQTITFIRTVYHPQFSSQNVFIVCKLYHNFELTINYDKTGHVQSVQLYRIYYRYAYYQAYNTIAVAPGYVAVGYILPWIYQQYDYVNHYIALYNTKDEQIHHNNSNGYEQRYMIAAYPMHGTSFASFAFNTTYQPNTNGTRIGLIISQPINSTSIYQFYIEIQTHSTTISGNLTLELSPDFKSQQLSLQPYSDFYHFSFKLQIINPTNDDDTSNEVLVIVLSVVGGLIGILVIIYIIFLVRKKIKFQKLRESLLTSEHSLRNTIDPQNNTGYSPPSHPIAQVQSSSSSSSSSSNSSSQNEEEDVEKEEEEKESKESKIQQQNQDGNNKENKDEQKNQQTYEKKQSTKEQHKFQQKIQNQNQQIVNEENIENEFQKKENQKSHQKQEDQQPK